MNNNAISCLRLSDFNPRKVIQLDKYSILYFTRGEGFITIDFNKVAYQKDSLFLLSKKQLLQLNNTREIDGFIVQVNSDTLKSITNNNSFLKQRRLFNYWINSPKTSSTNENFYSFILNLYKECKSNSNPIDSLISQNTLTGLLLKIYKSYNFNIDINNPEQLANQFKILVDNHITQTRNTLHYAKELGISYKHLNSVCKEYLNETAKDFITENTVLEIKRQQILGLTTNQISRELGFDEPTNFVKFRKKHFA